MAPEINISSGLAIANNIIIIAARKVPDPHTPFVRGLLGSRDQAHIGARLNALGYINLW